MYLPEKQLLPTCQSLGEIYLRLQQYENALTFQKRHLKIAKDAKDLIEQQRATTQLGRTYHELFLKSDDDHQSLRNAKKYFLSALELAHTVLENPLSQKASIIKEYIDAHNNIGVLEIDLDNLNGAEDILKKGLDICDAEAVIEDDDTRSRLHHNLAIVYLELRRWETAHSHIRKDITICSRIGHCQGEAKGYVSLGELHYKDQKYNEALSAYYKALELVKSLKEEDALFIRINHNIETMRKAMKVMDELKKEEQNLKNLERKTEMARGMETERKWLLKQYASLGSLIDKSRTIFAWIKLHEYSKRKKRIATELCDKEKLSDSFLVVGESYRQLRKFRKALKWRKKSLETYELIGNLEGQALAKINIGTVLDYSGDWAGGLAAFKEGHRIASNANLSSTQLSALENMHYSHMIRFDDADGAMRTKVLIDQLKQSNGEFVAEDQLGDCCSETATESDNQSTDDGSDVTFSPNSNELNSLRPRSNDAVEDWNENEPLISLLRSIKRLRKQRTDRGVALNASSQPCLLPNQSISRSTGSLTVNHKRSRVVVSDHAEIYCQRKVRRYPAKGTSTSNDCELTMRSLTLTGMVIKRLAVHGSHTCIGSFNSFHDENSLSDMHACWEEPCQHVIFDIDDSLVQMDLDFFSDVGKLSIEQMKVELGCFYYSRLSKEKRSSVLIPVIQHIIYNGRIMDSAKELLREYAARKGRIEVSTEMMTMYLMKLYTDCCEELAVPSISKVFERLYKLRVAEDDITVSNCELQDESMAPLLKALQLHKTIVGLDFSHNLLGDGTIEKLKQVLIPSDKHFGCQELNLHDNRLGPDALYHICSCLALFGRLEILNISGNRLTDSCASYLSTILESCKALYNLVIDNCCITSITIQKVANSLSSESKLTHLSIGYNCPVSEDAIISLLLKLASLNSFYELNLNGIKLTKHVVDSLCQFVDVRCLWGLMLGYTNIGNEGTMKLSKPWSKDPLGISRLDLSFCGLTCDYISSLSNDANLISGIDVLNLSGNPFTKEGSIALASLFSIRACCLRVLVVSKCELGLVGIAHLIQSMSTNHFLEKLNLSDNVKSSEIQTRTDDSSSSSLQKELEELIATIKMAEELKLIDLSQSGFSEEVAMALFLGWSSGPRAGLAERSLEERTVRFSVKKNEGFR